MSDVVSPRKFPYAAIAVGVVAAVGIAYGASSYAESKASEKPAEEAPAPAANAGPPVPPKVAFLGQAKIEGGKAATPAGVTGDPADVGADDAAIVWLKVDAPQGGGGGGRGGPRAAMTLKDESGKDFSYTPERREGGVMALHVKKGYDHVPKSLKLTMTFGDKELGSWDVKDLPAPQKVLDEKGADPKFGIVNLVPGRRGRLGAVARLTQAMPKDEGLIVRPIAASFLSIKGDDESSTFIGEPGQSTLQSALTMPNAVMQKAVQFAVTRYKAVPSMETVIFKTARIEDRFGQPTFVVDKEEVVTTASGVHVKLPIQDVGPKRAPRKTHSRIKISVIVDGESVVGKDGVIAPAVSLQGISPSPAELGLEKVELDLGALAPQGALQLFTMPAAAAIPAGKSGTVKTGPIPALTIRFALVKPKTLDTKNVIVPVNPKPLPAPARAQQ